MITAAAGRQDDSAMDWVLKVEGVTSTDELDHPGRDWVSLDRKLAAAIAEIAHGELGRQNHFDEQLRDERGADRTRSKAACPCLQRLRVSHSSRPDVRC